MRIAQETVQRIIQAADVTEVVGDFVSLKKRGANMIACCPFHNEKTPSFYVSPAKGIYKCFGCGKSGDSVRFVMDIEGLGYPEALKYLAKKYGIEVEEKEYSNEEIQAQNERESLFIVLEFAQKFYQKYLWENEMGKAIGWEYFKERGFNDLTIKTFDLGYSPDGWDVFTKEAIRNGFSIDILEKAGLSIIKEGKDPIDRFRGRVIFPIHNVAGKPIAFGARILKKDPNAPKYLNSPETAVYHKSNIVYGIYHAKNAIRQEDNCFLVEGYTDVVSLHQAGIQNVVASSGTSLTKEQIQLIRRFTNNITVLYDGDAAGIKASLRGIDIILEEGLNVKSVVFPDGDDPDSFVQKVGSQSFNDYIKRTAKDFIRFKTEVMLKDVGDEPIRRAEVISDLVNTISKVPDSIKRAVFYKEVANLLGIDEHILVTEGTKIQLKQVQDAEKDRQRQQNRTAKVGEVEIPVQQEVLISNRVNESTNLEVEDRVSSVERDFIKLLVNYGDAVIEETLEGYKITLAEYMLDETKDVDFENPICSQIVNTYRKDYSNSNILTSLHFTSHQNADVQKYAIDLVANKYTLDSWEKQDVYVPTDEEKLDAMAYKCILYLKSVKITNEIEKIAGKISTTQDFEEVMDLMLKSKLLKEKAVRLSKELGAVVQG